MAISKIVTNSVDSGVTLTSPVMNTITSAAATALTLQSAGTTAVTIDTSQNVGIGTSSPGKKLTVAGTTDQISVTTGINEMLVRANSTEAALYTFQAIPLNFYTNNTERMRIDSSGRVTKPYQTGFIATALASQTTYTANQVVVFSVASYNIGSGYSTSTGRFTAPIAGLYSFTFQIYLNPGNTNAPLAIYVNGTMNIFALQGVAINGIGLSTLISLSASDYVEVRVRNISGATATIFNGGDHTQFTGYLLG